MAAEEWDVFSLPPGGSDDPPTFLATLYRAFNKTIRVELDGTGSGQFSINRTSPGATTAILAKGNLVKVRVPEIDSGYIFAFFLETGDFTLVSPDEEGGETLNFGGRGALCYLEYGRAWNHSYIAGGQDPFDGLWRAYAAGTGKKPGQILRRVIEEFQDPDRPQFPIPLVTIDFDYTNDSGAVAWASTDATDEFTYQIGEDGLSIAKRLIDTDAITIQMGPDFDLHAWNRNDYGTDRSGDAFGAGVVRFEKGVNIVNELRRQLTGQPVVDTHMLVAGETDHFGTATVSDAADRVVHEAFMTTFGTGATALDGAGAAELSKRQRNLETIMVQIANRRTEVDLDDPVTVGSVVGKVATDGFYLPGPSGSDNGDFWVGDTVRVHTGVTSFDYNETDFLVTAITIQRDDDNHELIVIPELEEIAPVPVGQRLLVAYFAQSLKTTSPTDKSSYPWTEHYWSGEISNPLQFPGPGSNQAMGLYTRMATVGEDPTVLTFKPPTGHCRGAAWVHELDGIDPDSIELVSGKFTLGSGVFPNGCVGAEVSISDTAADPSVLFGGFSQQKVSYGGGTIYTTSAGTRLISANRINQTPVPPSPPIDGNPPWTYIGYDTGTGTLEIAAIYDNPPNPNEYSRAGIGYAAIRMKTVGTFRVVQSGHGSQALDGAVFSVTLPFPPGTL